MALIEKGRLVPDHWHRVADDTKLPEGAPVLVTLERLLAEAQTLRTRNAPVGVVLPSGTPASAIAEHLPYLSLVALEIPTFRDGRSFTTARDLRERFGFTGEIRAFGHILPDQYVFLLRCGVSTVELKEGTDPTRWMEALDQFDIAYQPALVGDSPLSNLRRHLALG